LKSLKVDPAVWIDTSPAGSGKTHADRTAAGVAESSLTVLPTHSNCREVEEFYSDGGLYAVAYPELSVVTCQNFEVADKALDAGLSVSAAICPTCRFRNACDYREMLADAEKAEHQIATHKRAQLSFEAIARGKKLIAVHEDAVGMLRPIEQVTLVGLRKLIDVAIAAHEAANFRGEWELDVFFQEMAVKAQSFIDQLEDATDTTSLLTAATAPRPPGVDFRLFKSMEELKVFPPGDTVRIVKAAVSGELAELVVRVDKVSRKPTTKDPKPEVTVYKNIIGVWDTKIPPCATTWLCDGTADFDEIATIVGGPIHNATPAGRLELQHPILQITADVKQKTAPGVVSKLLAGVLARFPDAERIGVICHRCHVATVRGTGHGSTITAAMAKRITKVEHFRSGASRGSNDWFESCDLLIVLGSPRVPPRGIKTRLIQTGRVMAAARDGKWHTDYWSGITTTGKRQIVKTLAYRDHEWYSAHRSIVRAELIQSVGRGRGVCENGIPVVVISNECLNFPILDETEFEPLTEIQVLALKAVFEFSVDSRLGKMSDSKDNTERTFFLNTITLGKMSLNPVFGTLVGLKLKITTRHADRILGALSRRDLVEKISERGGWKITEAGVKLLFPPDTTPKPPAAAAYLRDDLLDDVVTATAESRLLYRH